MNCPKCSKEKEETKKDDGGKWQARGDDDKRADGKIEAKLGQLPTMLK